MTDSNAPMKLTYYGFCWSMDAILSKYSTAPAENPRGGYRDMAQMVHDYPLSIPDRPHITAKRIQRMHWCMADGMEYGIQKRALGYACIELDPQLSDLHSELRPHVDTFFCESSAHVDLYRDNHCFLTYADAIDDQIIAQRDAVAHLAKHRLISKSCRSQFEKVLNVFDLMEAEGPPEHSELVILCKSYRYEQHSPPCPFLG
jgi:hypothetical protein